MKLYMRIGVRFSIIDIESQANFNFILVQAVRKKINLNLYLLIARKYFLDTLVVKQTW
jgi:hypothetical protein